MVQFSVSSGCFLFLSCCPPLVVRGGTVCLPLPPLWPAGFFNNNHPNWCEAVPPCSSDLHFPRD